jgi:hypothetical protein
MIRAEPPETAMRFCIALVLALGTLSCVRGQAAPPKPTPTPSPAPGSVVPFEDLGPAQTPTPTLPDRVDMLEYGQSNQDDRIDHLEEVTNIHAYLDASRPGAFIPVTTAVGRFYLSLENAEPYLDGYRVALDVGNPNFVTFNGFKISAIWAGVPGNKDWGKKRVSQKREFSFTETLQPGAWTRVRIELSPAAPDDIKLIELSIETNQLSLRKTR